MDTETVLQPKKGKKKIILTAVAILMVLAVGSISGFAAYRNSDTVQLRKSIELGNRYLDELKYEEAVAEFTRALDIVPGDEEAMSGLADAYTGWGTSLSDAGEYESAAGILTEAYGILPEDDGVRELLIRTYLAWAEEYADRGEYEKAIEVLDEAYGIIPDAGFEEKKKEYDLCLQAKQVIKGMAPYDHVYDMLQSITETASPDVSRSADGYITTADPAAFEMYKSCLTLTERRNVFLPVISELEEYREKAGQYSLLRGDPDTIDIKGGEVLFPGFDYTDKTVVIEGKPYLTLGGTYEWLIWLYMNVRDLDKVLELREEFAGYLGDDSWLNGTAVSNEYYSAQLDRYGRRISEENSTGNGIKDIKYDDEGNFISCIDYYVDSGLEVSVTYEYSDGRPVRSIYTYSDNPGYTSSTRYDYGDGYYTIIDVNPDTKREDIFFDEYGFAEGKYLAW